MLSNGNILRWTVLVDAQLCQCAIRHRTVLFKLVDCMPCKFFLSRAVKTEGEMKTFPNKQQLREFISGRSNIRKIVKGVLQAAMKGCE